MSIFAGVYNLFKTEVDLGQIRCQISESLSIENRKDLIYQNDHFFLLKFDYGLFDDNGYYVSGTNGVCALSGEPYINNCDHLSRNEQLLDLWDKLFHKSNDVLKECTGTYSICFYNNNDHSLLLATDKVGVRPLYFAVIDNLLYFANSLKVFEKIDAVPKILNFRSCIEKPKISN